ncbi:hypothetical protein [Streptomyces huiliensis]|uniref:hypothetical protein n=1 Tax=Streptomyces huiliensis TaxID=2876027 RepID=UPI001CBA77F8|nr:hypothetical protein [Streptomyces huiliensis]MBZ4319223.1 hypothetical protein [Streptomyces huiliensis]
MTPAMPPAPVSGPESVPRVRALLGDAFDSVRATVADNNPDISYKVRGHIVDEAVKFVATAARFPQWCVVPSRSWT